MVWRNIYSGASECCAFVRTRRRKTKLQMPRKSIFKSVWPFFYESAPLQIKILLFSAAVSCLWQQKSVDKVLMMDWGLNIFPVCVCVCFDVQRAPLPPPERWWHWRRGRQTTSQLAMPVTMATRVNTHPGRTPWRVRCPHCMSGTKTPSPTKANVFSAYCTN